MKNPVLELSTLLNAAHKKSVPSWETPSWFKLFRKVDSDGSGLISYDEFVEMVRTDLKLSARALPEAQLQMLWRALDTDGSGYLSSGEFGAFMRLAQSSQSGHAAAHRMPPRPPRALAASHGRASHVRKSEFLTNSTRDMKKLRAQMDAQVERELRASRTRYLLGDAGGEDDAPLSAYRPQNMMQGMAQSVMQSKAVLDNARDVQVLHYQLAQVQAQAQRIERLIDAKESQSGSVDGLHISRSGLSAEPSELLSVLLANAPREVVAKAFEALTPERRHVLRDISKALDAVPAQAEVALSSTSMEP